MTSTLGIDDARSQPSDATTLIQGNGSTQTQTPGDQNNEDQLGELGDMSDAEIITKTGIQLSELPLMFDDI